MRIDELITRAQDMVTVERVYSGPYERDGVTVIPAAAVSGGGGGGGGSDETGQEGLGGGFGLNARPAGVYVIADGQVRWQPAVDVNRALSAVAAVAVVYLLTRWRIARIRARTEA